MLYSTEFYDELFLNRNRELFSKIELLDWNENTISEIQGKVISGSLSLDSTSSIRRTCTISVIVDDDTYNITSINNMVSINKKLKISIGMTNTTVHYQQYGDTIWFPLGFYVVSDASNSITVDGDTINLNVQDKMCLLNGDVGGELKATTELHQEDYYNTLTSTWTKRPLKVYDVIHYAVVGLGGESAAKVIINDVPLQIKSVVKNTSTSTKYFDANGNELPSTTGAARSVAPGAFAGYKLVDFNYPEEFVKSAGDVVTSILDDIVALLGNFEYFYDINGYFIFQEIKNYINTSFTPLTEVNNDHYMVDFSKNPYVYSLKDKYVVNSYSNVPNYKNIKNDFVVWGKTTSGGTLMYHLAIDNKPYLPPTYTKPWQQFLIEYGDANTASPGDYYSELKTKFSQIYNANTNQWSSDPSLFNYYFDMIDSKSELGKYSVSTIGRRRKVLTDDKISILYPPTVPDYVILPTTTSSDYKSYLNTVGIKFCLVSQADYDSVYIETATGKDAFTVMRELLYTYTTFNETININCLPLYFLDGNQRIEVEYQKANIYGDYIIKSMTVPFDHESLMTINAIRVTSRI